MEAVWPQSSENSVSGEWGLSKESWTRGTLSQAACWDLGVLSTFIFLTGGGGGGGLSLCPGACVCG